MTRIAPLLTVILTWSLMRWAAAENPVLCTWTKVLSNGEVHCSFLRRGFSSVRLYHSAWSGERSLLGCTWSDDAAVTNSYFYLCRERTQEFSGHPDENLGFFNSVLESEHLCVSMASLGALQQVERAGKRSVRSVGGLLAAETIPNQDERSEVGKHRRVKRGIIVPGTLWCGSGNKAPSFEDLGVFTNTDSCCREHDQCKHTILSFHSGFGVFNSNIFTMSHCDCDNQFRSCLMGANDSISTVVGYTFFNLLKMQCFEFAHRLQCTQRNWFGMCKETKMALYAEVHPPTLFESPSPTEDSMNSTSTSTTPVQLPDNSTSHPQLLPVTTAASITPVSSGGPAGSAPGAGNHLQDTSPAKNQTRTDAAITKEQLSCDVYKALDECRNRILPQQTKYGLHNPEPRTLYHCNCTTRLFQTLADQRRLTEAQALLVGHVSRSCFLPQNCTAGTICTAVVVKAELPQLDHRSGAGVEERHLQAMWLKVRRLNSRRAKRRDQAVGLYKLCVRLSRPRPNKTRTRSRDGPQPAAGAQLD
ncbi:group 3 secretory phospholipase A2 [Mastacembelus armatus]|uniref:group 3 secretory phospholipase A2 n=1 Tax=Mastacembelus armatus TaxID=205130 RepID=UPI000E45E954|nr:group 3 secretory phospholipase A2-like [Mastacembelus armatus]